MIAPGPAGRSAEDSPESFAQQIHPLTQALRTFGLLSLIGASLALAVGYFRTESKLFREYVVDNHMGRTGRLLVVANLAGGALVGSLVGAVLMWRRRRSGRASALASVDRFARRLAPCALAFSPPLVFDHELWIGRDLTFMAFVTAVGLTSIPLWRMSLETGPILPFSLRQRLAMIFGAWIRVFGSRRAARVAVCLGALAYAAYFSYYTIHAHHNLTTSSYDLGIENNLMWNLIHGGPLFKTTPHDAGPQGSHLGYHQTYLSFVLAPFYAISPRPETLLVIQSLLIGLAAIPLFLLACRRLPAWTAAALSLSYLLYAPVHGAHLYDFHYPPFMPFFIWFLLYFVERGDTWKALLFTLLSISIREDVAGCVGLIGAYMILTNLRPRLGLAIMFMGLTHFVIVKMVVMPWVLGGRSAYIHQYRDLIPRGIGGFGGVLVTVLGNPAFTLKTLMAEEQKLLYILQIMAPLVFLPWRRPVGALLSLPGFFFTLLATFYEPMIQISFQYTFFWTTFMFIAAIRNLDWLQTPKFPGDTRGAVVRASWTLALVGAMLASSHQHGGVFQTNTIIGGFRHVRLGPDPAARSKRADLYQLIAKVPPNAKIVSGEHIVPHVSSREYAYTLRVGIFDADYILYDMTKGDTERRHVREVLAEGKYGVVETRGDFLLAKKGHSKQQNLEVLRRLHGG